MLVTVLMFALCFLSRLIRYFTVYGTSFQLGMYRVCWIQPWSHAALSLEGHGTGINKGFLRGGNEASLGSESEVGALE